MSSKETDSLSEQASVLSYDSTVTITNSRFPRALNLYNVSDSGWRPGTYVLGERRGQPLYVCACHSSLSSSSPIILHSGPAESFPPLATIEWRSFSSSFYVDLPSLNSPGVVTPTREEIKSVGMLGMGGYRFSIEVGLRNIREQFEWRHSSGTIVKELGEDGSDGSGWKLVRLANGLPDGMNASVSTADGHEIVAAWVQTPGNMVGKFCFMGTGSSGLLGERWAIITLASFCAMIERIRRNNPSLAMAAASPPV